MTWQAWVKGQKCQHTKALVFEPMSWINSFSALNSALKGCSKYNQMQSQFISWKGCESKSEQRLRKPSWSNRCLWICGHFAVTLQFIFWIVSSFLFWGNSFDLVKPKTTDGSPGKLAQDQSSSPDIYLDCFALTNFSEFISCSTTVLSSFKSYLSDRTKIYLWSPTGFGAMTNSAHFVHVSIRYYY